MEVKSGLRLGWKFNSEFSPENKPSLRVLGLGSQKERIIFQASIIFEGRAVKLRGCKGFLPLNFSRQIIAAEVKVTPNGGEK